MTDETAVRERLVAALHRLGVQPESVVYLGLDLTGIALPRWPAPRGREAMRERRDQLCRFVHGCVREAIGPAGTVLAAAFSYGYARHGTPYEHETSPAEVGPFPEWFRRQAGVRRSFHPLFSVCGEGPAAAAILEKTGRSAFGAGSPFARLAARGTIFVSLGVALARWLTYAHHLEQLAGVNHAYHKIFTVPARRGGVEVPGPFLAFVRYLGAGVEISLDRFEAALRRDGALRESRDEAGFLQAVACADVDRIGLALLQEDPAAFIAAPVDIHIDAPGARRQPDGPRPTVRFVPEVSGTGGASA
jgi:aminoglycoside 3-N-acetyltransferase